MVVRRTRLRPKGQKPRPGVPFSPARRPSSRGECRPLARRPASVARGASTSTGATSTRSVVFLAQYAALLAAEPDIEVMSQAADGEAACDLARRLRPDVVLSDLAMPRMDGIAVARQVKQDLPECAVVVLTIHHDDDHLFGAIKAGALGYVLKEAPPEQMLEAIRAAARGEGFLGPPLVGRMLDEFARGGCVRAAAKEGFAELTRREMEVLELVGQGLGRRSRPGSSSARRQRRTTSPASL